MIEFFLFRVSLNLLKCTSDTDDRIHLKLEFIINNLNDTKKKQMSMEMTIRMTFMHLLLIILQIKCFLVTVQRNFV